MKNLLPYDGEAYLLAGDAFFTEKALFEKVEKDVKWRKDEVVMFGKRLTLRRLSAWYGDKPFEYTYSQISRQALPWTATLTKIKKEVERLTGESFNSCLLNFYHDGDDHMGWHSDDETELDPSAGIASVSLGAERKFAFKHRRTKETVSVFLPNGSVLVMKAPVQEHWLHTLRKSKKVTEGRINLTFRTHGKT